MQKILRYKKCIGLTVVVSMILLNFTLSPARAVMITTEYAMVQDSEQLSDRARIKTFLARADVMAQLQAYGINHTEALSRVDSLADREITALADRMDQFASRAGGYEMGSGGLWIVGLLLYAIIFFIVFYFSRANIEEKQAEAAATETEEKEQPSTSEKEEKPE